VASIAPALQRLPADGLVATDTARDDAIDANDEIRATRTWYESGWRGVCALAPEACRHEERLLGLEHAVQSLTVLRRHAEEFQAERQAPCPPNFCQLDLQRPAMIRQVDRHL